MDGITFIKYGTLDAQDVSECTSNICLSLREVAKDTEYRVAVSYSSHTLPSQPVKKYCASVYIPMRETEQQETKVAWEETLSNELGPQGFRTASKMVLGPSYYTLDKDSEWNTLFSIIDVGGDVNAQSKDERPRAYSIQSVVAVCRDIPFWLVREGKVQKDSRVAMRWLTNDAQRIDDTRLAKLWKPSEYWEGFSKGKAHLESIDPVDSTPGDRGSDSGDSVYFDARSHLSSTCSK